MTEEILECIGVAVSLGGTMAEGEATRLIGYLEDRDVIWAALLIGLYQLRKKV
jgi:hypothetical protein